MENNNEEVGKCCFCGFGCNPCSQSCGGCARIITGHALGWNNLPPYLKYLNSYENTRNKDDEFESKSNNSNSESDSREE
jgi:hypothetical protein